MNLNHTRAPNALRMQFRIRTQARMVAGFVIVWQSQLRTRTQRDDHATIPLTLCVACTPTHATCNFRLASHAFASQSTRFIESTHCRRRLTATVAAGQRHYYYNNQTQRARPRTLIQIRQPRRHVAFEQIDINFCAVLRTQQGGFHKCVVYVKQCACAVLFE